MLTVLFKYVFVEVWVQIGIRQHRELKMEDKRMRSKQFISTCLLSVALGGAAMAAEIVIGYAAPSLDGAQAQIQGGFVVGAEQRALAALGWLRTLMHFLICASRNHSFSCHAHVFLPPSA